MPNGTEKQASSEIAERLKKYKAEIFGNKPILIGGIGWQHGDLIQLLELAERDTRELCAQRIDKADELIAALLLHRRSGSKATSQRVHKLIGEYERIRGKE